jgi:hypothetical protein
VVVATPSLLRARVIQLRVQEALQASNRLYDNATKLRVKRSQQKATLPDGCTFTPEVTARARKTGVATGQERFEHLFRNAAAISTKLEQQRQRVGDLDLPRSSFRVAAAPVACCARTA